MIVVAIFIAKALFVSILFRTCKNYFFVTKNVIGQIVQTQMRIGSKGSFPRTRGADLWALGDNLQFYPNFTLFSWLGRINLDHNFFSGEQIKLRPKKRSSPKMEHFFSPNSSEDLRSAADQSQIIGGDADEDHPQIIRRDTVKLWGDISPIPPGFRHPCQKHYDALSVWELNREPTTFG